MHDSMQVSHDDCMQVSQDESMQVSQDASKQVLMKVCRAFFSCFILFPSLRLILEDWKRPDLITCPVPMYATLVGSSPHCRTMFLATCTTDDYIMTTI